MTHGEYSHFRLQFTPTLVLLLPLYRLIDHQFLLVAVGAIGYFASFLVMFSLLDRIGSRSGIKGNASRFIPLASVGCALLIMTNRYTKNVLTSAHYEFLFPLLWSLLAYAMIEAKPWFYRWVSFALLVGLRSDASFFVAFQLAALYFLPPWVPADLNQYRRSLWVFGIAAILYFCAIIAVVNPLFGSEDNFLRWWGHLGTGPLEIAWTVIRSPLTLFKAIFKGGFLDLNLSFFLLPLLVHPGFFVLMNLPAIPNYLMVFPERQSLFYYHSAVLLPLFYLGVGVGLIILLQRLNDLSRPIRVVALLLMISIIPVQALTFRDTNNGFKFRIYPGQQREFAKQLNEVIRGFAEVKSVATDVDSIVYVSHSKELRVLEQYEHSDFIILKPTANALLTPGRDYLKTRAKILSDERYRLVRHTEQAEYLIKRTLNGN